MKIRAKCPASCGELIQGWMDGGEKLVSYPINWYSEVTLETNPTDRKSHAYLKATQAYRKTCRYFGLTEKEIPAVSLSVASTIPVAKGMASSTADIAATVAATTRMLGVEISPAELSKICLSIEATDSTVFPSLTFFDHLRGEYIEESNWSPEFQVLVLEPDEILTTVEYRKERQKGIDTATFQHVYQIYKQAVEQRSTKLLGEAATLSAISHQKILPKKNFEELLEIREKFNLLGVNVAHSGTVVGLMYDESAVDRGELLWHLTEKKILNNYSQYYFRKSVSGGVSLMEE